MKAAQKLKLALTLLVGVVVVGTLGYHYIEGWSFQDSLYMVIITLSSVGFEEVYPLSTVGQNFTIILIGVGTGIFLLCLATLTAFVVEGELTDILWRKKMESGIRSLKDHYIICGGGDVGHYVIDELVKTDRPCVLIERCTRIIENLKETFPNLLILEGDATHDDDLLKAGIEKAQCLLSILGDDADNLFVTLSARGLNPKLKIIARSVRPNSAEKLRRAGANNVVFPEAIGGLRLASAAIRPHVVDFLDEMLRGDSSVLRMEEFKIEPSSPLARKTLAESQIPQKTGLIVIAIRAGDGDNEYRYNPNSAETLQDNDTVIVMGSLKQMEKMKALI